MSKYEEWHYSGWVAMDYHENYLDFTTQESTVDYWKETGYCNFHNERKEITYITKVWFGDTEVIDAD